MSDRPRVTGIGGIFLRAENPGKLARWYGETRGVPLEIPEPNEGPRRSEWDLQMARC
jgi:hypothetical protein